MTHNQLNAKGNGEFKYDLKHDVLFFKIKEREYQKSLNFDDIVIDLDKQNFITGIQIFEASKLFTLDKYSLSRIRAWEFSAKAETKKENAEVKTVITISILFETKRRNAVIVERGQNLVRETPTAVPNKEVLCTVPAAAA